MPLISPLGPAISRTFGWRFYGVRPSGHEVDIKPTKTGSLAYDDSSDVRMTLSGFVFLPDQIERFDPTKDVLRAQLLINNNAYDMGYYYATSLSRQKDALIHEGAVSDLVHIDFSDGFVKLLASTENPITAPRGADPSQLIVDFAKASGFQTSVANAESVLGSQVVWDPFTSAISVINELVPVAGHRPPWIDHAGVFRSIAANVVESEVIPLLNLNPVAATIVISETYLSAPNRVVVYDDQAGYPLTGIWEAPASAPNSYANRGYWITQANPQQGLASIEAAQLAAKALGEQLSSRTLDCYILPTPDIDGPRVISYDNALWLIRSWSLGTEDGALMSITATELPNG